MPKNQRSSLEMVFKCSDGIFEPVSTYKKQEFNKKKNGEWDGHLIVGEFYLLDSKATVNQFRYLYGHLYQEIHKYLVENSGYTNKEITIEDIDRTFKEMYACESKPNVLTGEIQTIVKDKKKFSVTELKEYINNVYSYCVNELNIKVHTPEEFYEEYSNDND